jgi:uncharacterized protein (TIGR03067 family)
VVNRIALSAVVTALLVAAAGAEPPAAVVKAETAKLEGAWAVAAQEHAGQPDQPADFQNLVFIIKEDKIVARYVNLQTGDDQRLPMDYRIDPTAQPKTIDLTYAEGALKGQTVPGIYSVQDDVLTVCLSRGGARPTNFATQGFPDRELTVLQRKK